MCNQQKVIDVDVLSFIKIESKSYYHRWFLLHKCWWLWQSISLQQVNLVVQSSLYVKTELLCLKTECVVLNEINRKCFFFLFYHAYLAWITIIESFQIWILGLRIQTKVQLRLKIREHFNKQSALENKVFKKSHCQTLYVLPIWYSKIRVIFKRCILFWMPNVKFKSWIDSNHLVISFIVLCLSC